MNKNILVGLFVFLILLTGINIVQAISPSRTCPQESEWSSELQKCIVIEKPITLKDLEKESFKPNIAVWFKNNVTENEAKNLIESFGLTKYSLSEVWPGAMAVIEVPQGSNQEYIQRFKESDIVENAELNIVETTNLNIVYQPSGQSEQQLGYKNITLIISIIIVIIIFVLFLIWYKFYRK